MLLGQAQSFLPFTYNNINGEKSASTAKMACFSSPATTINPSASLNFFENSNLQFFNKSRLQLYLFKKSDKGKKISGNGGLRRNPIMLRCTEFRSPTFVSETESEYETEGEYNSSEEYAEGGEGQAPRMVGNGQTPPPVKRQRRRYRKQYPGEKNGITEEMRFVAMKLRNSGKVRSKNNSAVDGESEEEETGNEGAREDNSEENNDRETWQPSMDGFLKYLVDSELVFSTVERIVDESTDVSCKVLSPLFFYFFPC